MNQKTKQGLFPPDLSTLERCRKRKGRLTSPTCISISRLVATNRAVTTADHASALVTDLHTASHSGREFHHSLPGRRDDSAREVGHSVVDETVAHLGDVLRVVPGTTAHVWVSRGAVSGVASSRRRRRGALAGESGGGARWIRSRRRIAATC